MSVWLPRSNAFLLARNTTIHSRLLVTASALPHTRYNFNRQLPLSYYPPLKRYQSTSPQPQPDSKSTSTSLEDPEKSARPAASPPVTKDKNVEKAPLGTRVWQKVKHEVQHYWAGSKLLAKEVRISARLQWKILHGESLTRRERRQLKRTTQDLLRLIPFAVFVIVPFMEFLLPVALKLFPNMLPSTFEDKYAADEKARKLLRVRLEMAKFLQETLRESGLKANAHIVGSEEFKEFFRKVRSTGESPSTQDIVNVAKLFDDDLTLDNLSRPQLVSMCRYMAINAFGTDNFLRGAIRGRLVQLRRDDQLIYTEGIDALSTSELQAACQSRGIRAWGISPARLREELTTWINLHLHHRVSGVLLILGRAFAYDTSPASDGDGLTSVVKSLEHVLSGLPDNLLNEAELEVDSDKASYKQRLEVLQQQQELIEDEEEQEQKEEDARRARKAAEDAKREEETRLAESLLPDSELQPEPEEDARMTTEQLKELAEVLSVLTAKSSVLKERDELRALMEENAGTEEEPANAALVRRIRSMLTRIDTQLEAYDAKVGNSLQMISCDARGRIPILDVEKALQVIKHKPDEDVMKNVIEKLDADKDGFVELEHVLALAKDEGLGILVDNEAQNILGAGREIKDSRPRKEDIVQDVE